MKSLKLIQNSNNIEIENYTFRFTRNEIEYTEQKIRIVLKFVKREWYLDVNKGIPYFSNNNDENIIFTKNPVINFIEDIFKTEIKKVSTVEKIISFSSEINQERLFIVNFTIKLKNGELLTIQEVF